MRYVPTMTHHDKAVSLMRMALALLDDAGEHDTSAACYLQAAIDSATGAPLSIEAEAIDRMASDLDERKGGAGD